MQRMENSASQQKARVFKELHHSGTVLVLPNIWDPLGARLLESLGYPAVATASASVALTNGYDDGERIPFNDVVTRLAQIVKSVALPVTADIESGYTDTEEQLQKNIEALLETGIVGINFEDYNKRTGLLLPIESQCRRIKLIRKVADAMQVQLFINARTDVVLRGKEFGTEQKMDETLNRGKAYLNAGADCFFPLAVKNKNELVRLMASLQCPINVLALPGIPDFKTLRDIGIARVSLGPGFLKIAIKAMKTLAMKLKNYDGLEEVIENEVTSEYLKNLVNG